MTDRARAALEILLVDDSDDDVLLVREAIAVSQRLVIGHVASDGVEALRYLREDVGREGRRRPALILLDINMPRLDGFETLDAIKRDETLRDIPVVMLTVSDREDDVLRAYRAGAATYVRKPLGFPEFARTLLRLQRYWTQVARLPGADERRG